MTLAAADPAGVRHDAPATVAIEPAASAAQSLLNVLYVEDNGPNIALIQALIARRPRWRLHVARTAAEGLQRARELRPDLVLIDLHLPDQSGEVVLQALRADPQAGDTLFAILSADALPATVERLRVNGAAEYLTKPIDVSRLFALLDRVAA